MLVFVCFFRSTKRNAIHVFHCFPVVVTAQFIFFIYPVIRNQAIAVTFVTQPFQFNFTTTALSQLTIFRLHSVSSTSFCPIFLYSFHPLCVSSEGENAGLLSSKPMGGVGVGLDSHFGRSHLADPCLWRVLAHLIPWVTFVNKVDI